MVEVSAAAGGVPFDNRSIDQSMCGIAGIFARPDGRRGPLAARAEAMAATLNHRGPDDSGSWADEEAGIAFGFRRLAIVDLTLEGHQPMRSASGRYTMVFNGEIYNHEVLREDLERSGAVFRGRSDTEVALAAFERWGVHAALDRFEGMFAIGLWDASERSLTLIRDRLGIKPLFYAFVDGALCFASELKALAVLPEFDRSIDRAALTSYLRHLYVAAPATIYRHARKLLPGHVMTIHDPASGRAEPEPYWSLHEVIARSASDPFRGSDDEAVAALEALLLDSVRSHLRADVPLGAFLSAGIDSTTVVAMMQELLPRPVRSFSIAFDAAEHNEAPEAARLAAHMGTDHTELLLTGKEALDVVPHLPDIFDEPHADISQIPVYLLCSKARQELTVALSGDGGDEVFGGYNRYTRGPALFDRFLRVPYPVRRALSAGIERVPPGRWDSLHGAVAPWIGGPAAERLVGEKMQKLARMLGATSDREMYRALVSAWPSPAALVNGGEEVEGVFERALSDRALPPLSRLMVADQLTYLPDDQLAKVDRVSMAVSLEVRVPLVDHRVVEFAWRLPERMKVREGKGKWLLREVLYRRVPRALVDRPKMGLSVPVGDWLRGPLRDWAETLLEASRIEREGVLRAEPVRRAWRGLLDGREENALGLWAILMFQGWRERWAAG